MDRMKAMKQTSDETNVQKALPENSILTLNSKSKASGGSGAGRSARAESRSPAEPNPPHTQTLISS